MARLDEIETFVAIIEEGSLSAAARRSGLALSAVSRRLKDLEARMGVMLLRRTTRSQSLTEAGQEFHLRCRQILSDLDEAEASLRDKSGGLSGRIRMAAPVSFTALHLSGLLSDFLAAHPQVTLELDLSDQRLNLVEEGYDLALRIGRLEDSGLIARRLTVIRHLPVAAPGLIARLGQPERPEDLADFPALRYLSARRRAAWRFRRPDGSDGQVSLKARMLCNNGDVLVRSAVQGLGLCLEPTFVTAPAIAQGQLVPLFADHIWSDNAAYIVFAPGRVQPRRVRALIDFLAKALPDPPPWDETMAKATRL